MADRGGSRSRGTRMTKEWTGPPGASLILTTTSTVLGGILNLNIAGTVLRMIGEYVISPTGAPAAADKVRIGMGIALVSSDAAAVGGSAIPDPIGDPEYPWLFWADHPFFFIDASVDPVAAAVSQIRFKYDIRSMRKFKPGESLVQVVEYADVSGTPPMTVLTGTTRVLVAT